MLPCLRRALPAFSFLLLGLLPPARAQRVEGPPTQDPFERPPAAPVATRGLGNYQSHSLYDNILTIRSTDGSTLRVRPWATGVVRVEYFPAGQPVQEIESVSVVQAPVSDLLADNCNPGCDGPPTPDRIARFGNLICQGIFNHATDLTWNLGCSGIVNVQKKPLRIVYQRYSPPQNTLAAEAGGAFSFAPAADGKPGGAGVSFRLAPDEHLYGTGSRALPLDRRGRKLTLYNEAHYAYQNGEPTLNVTLPTVVSSRGYMLFFDNHTAGTLDLGATDKNVLEYRGEGLNQLAYFLITGDSYAEILRRYTDLTGHQPLPPRWALGLIQSRFGYRTEQEMDQVARRMRRANFPLDGLVLDLYWFGGTTRQGDFAWVQPNFPDPRRMMRRLDSTGVKTVLISEPYIMRTSRHDALVRQQELVGRNAAGQPYTVESFWAGPATLVDMFRPRAREWLWQQYDRLKQDGVGGWWSDLGEPENQPADMVYDAGPTRRIHNAYGQAWASILSEGYANKYPQERLFNLARSGWAGMQRHSVFPWSGDVQRTWSGLQAQVPIMLSMGLGGVGYMHSDAGGFCVGPVDAELYTRWLQMASLCPILRPHGEGVPPEAYWYPEPYQSAVRDYTHLRYQLLPYLYTLAWENNQFGTPLVRPMHFGSTEFHSLVLHPPLQPPTGLQGAAAELTAEEKAAGFEDKPKEDLFGNHQDLIMNGWTARRTLSSGAPSKAPLLDDINDQYLLGPNLLVAPVLQPGQRRRNVVLPPGDWVDFFTHQTLPGNQTVGRNAPLARTPVLVRAGAILPLAPYVPTTARYRTDTLRVRYYADPAVPQSSFTMYEDDGKTGQVGEQFQLIAFSGATTAAGTTLRVAVRGTYPGAPAGRTVELLIPRVAAAPAAVLLDNQPQPATAWQYAAATQTLRLRFALGTAPVQVSLSGLQLNTRPAADLAPETLALEAPSERTFGNGTQLRYTLFEPGRYPLQIKNSRGEVIATLPTEATVGAHEVRWAGLDQQGRPVPGGVYWAEMNGQHQRLILIR